MPANFGTHYLMCRHLFKCTFGSLHPVKKKMVAFSDGLTFRRFFFLTRECIPAFYFFGLNCFWLYEKVYFTNGTFWVSLAMLGWLLPLKQKKGVRNRERKRKKNKQKKMWPFYPDPPFHNFRASRSGDQRILGRSKTSCDGFWSFQSYQRVGRNLPLLAWFILPSFFRTSFFSFSPSRELSLSFSCLDSLGFCLTFNIINPAQSTCIELKLPFLGGA